MLIRALLLGALLAGAPPLARPAGGAPQAPVPAPTAAAADQPPAGHELSRAEATAIVKRRYTGRVIRTTVVDEPGRRVYVFRMLSDQGEVWTVRIDARNGVSLP